jgi:GNAT superfamily N-acetyltransferase
MNSISLILQEPPCEIETQLSDGRPICLRTIRPSDQRRIRDGISSLSDRSRYLRFFSAFREVPESVVKKLSSVDGHNHIGWGAILLDGESCPPIAAAHAIRSTDDPTVGELAIAVLDEYQGLGLARALLAAVLCDCAAENFLSLEMHILAENNKATKLVLGLGAERKSEMTTEQYYTLNIKSALDRLRSADHGMGVTLVLDQFGHGRNRDFGV